MTLSDRARRNHDALFPGHVSTLAVTDPELIEIFDNYAFDEILDHATLDARTDSFANWRRSPQPQGARRPDATSAVNLDTPYTERTAASQRSYRTFAARRAASLRGK